MFTAITITANSQIHCKQLVKQTLTCEQNG